MIVDVHGHVTHPELLKRYPMPPVLGDIEGMIERKAEAGIELTIVGSPVGFGTMMPVPGLDLYSQPLDELKSFHEWLAETCREHEGRLAGYVWTNPFGGPEWDEQAAQTVRDGGFLGLIVNTSVQGEYLDSERADGFFAMAAELGKPIFLHPPAEPVGAGSLSDWRLVEQVQRFADVTVGLAALVFGGRMEENGELDLIAATAGGAIGLLAGRLDTAWKPRHYGGGPPGGGPPGGGPPPWARFENKIEQAPSTYLSRVYVDTANSSVPNQLANLELMGPERMLFGSDSPPLSTPLDDAIAMVRNLPVSDEAKDGILAGNARRLFDLDGR